jgi:glycosyltransferase involved in cell wall biosynthesis
MKFFLDDKMTAGKNLSGIKVLVVSSKYPPEYAGSGLRAHRTYKRLKEKYGIEFEVLTSSLTSNTIEKYDYEGVAVYRIAKKIFRIAGFGEQGEKERISIFTKIKSKINYLLEGDLTFFYLWKRRKDFSLFHIFGNNNVTSVAITFSKIFNIPLVIEICTDVYSFYQREPFPFFFFIKKLPFRTHFVCISEKLKERCVLWTKGKYEIWCRPNPVDETKFYVDREIKYRFRSEYSRFKKEDILLVYIAKFRPSKNQLFLIEIMKLLPSEYKLLLTGPLVEEGPLFKRDFNYFNEIVDKIKKYNLENRIEIKKGFIENVNRYIKMADVYTFPSKSEGLGTPILESIACGIPVVANRIERVTDMWIKDGKNGYLSELRPEEFADKIEKVMLIKYEDLKKSSEEILNLASTKVIDREYFNRIQELIDK